MFDVDGNTLGTKPVQSTTGNGQVSVSGEVYTIEFSSNDADSWSVMMTLTQNGIEINNLFTCIDCVSVAASLEGITVGIGATSVTMADASNSAGCDTICHFVRNTHPCHTGPCDDDATCVDNNDGTATCTCNNGFIGDGLQCQVGCHQEDINCMQNVLDHFCTTLTGVCADLNYARFHSGNWDCYAELDCDGVDDDHCHDGGTAASCKPADLSSSSCDKNTEIGTLISGGCPTNPCDATPCPADATCQDNAEIAICQCNEGFTPTVYIDSGVSTLECLGVFDPLFN